MILIETLPKTVTNDFLSMMLGERLGTGKTREVYVHGLDSSLVVKLETVDSRDFCNVHEWSLWNETVARSLPARERKTVQKWLAPCISISPMGSVLIQARTEPIDKVPRYVPDFLADTHPQNWGLYEGRPVMHDYGNHAIYQLAFRHMNPKGRDLIGKNGVKQ